MRESPLWPLRCLRLLAPGHYEVRVLRIGYRPTIIPQFDIATGETKNLSIVLRGEALEKQNASSFEKPKALSFETIAVTLPNHDL